MIKRIAEFQKIKIFMLLLCFCLNYFRCIHDIQQREVLRNSDPEPLLKATTINMKTTGREPIRVKFDMNFLVPGANPQQCTSEGSPDPTCTGKDVVTNEKKAILEKVFEDVAKFVAERVNVTRRTTPITGMNTNSNFKHLSNVPSSVSNCDLYIPILAPKYSSDIVDNVIASAVYITLNTDPIDFNRPIVGMINVNPAMIPSQYTSYKDGERKYFSTIYHELNHILAFSDNLFNKWIDVTTNAPYTTVLKNVNDSYGNFHRYIQTPALQRFVQKRFNIVDQEIKNIGLDLETGGGPGTAFSHPDSRLYFTDVMQGTTYGVAWISDLTFSAMEDSGWYTVNHSLAEPLVYLIAQYFSDEKTSDRVLVDPPVYSFPKSMLCNNLNQIYCFYDYSAKASCALVMNNTVKLGDVNWTNPFHSSYVGNDELVDHAPILIPANNCRESGNSDNDYDYAKWGEYYGKDSVCAMSTIYKDGFTGYVTSKQAACLKAWCGTDMRVRIKVGSEEKLCLHTNQKLEFKGYSGYAFCPPGEAACQTMDKVEVINIIEVTPNHGPINGGNYVSIFGKDFDKYPDLEFDIGGINCNIVDRADTKILCRLDENKKINKKLISDPQPVTGRSKSKDIATTIPGLYIFSKRSYSSGSIAKSSPMIIGFIAFISLLL